MAGRVFVTGGAARGSTVVVASRFGLMLWAFLSPPERACHSDAGEQARLDDGLVPR